MPSRSRRRVLMSAVVVLAAGAGAVAYFQNPAWPAAAPIPGIVHETEIHVAPEIGGRLESVRVAAGQRVRRGDLLAVLSAPELSASVQEAQAAAAQALADRNNVFAGVRKEQIEISAENVDIAESNLALAQQEYKRSSVLAAKNFASLASLDESNAAVQKARASLESLRALHDRDEAGPTREERDSAAAKVALAEAAAADLEARLAETRILAPVDGTVGLLVASPGEVISPGQSIMTLEADRERWLSLTIREDRLGPTAVGGSLRLATGTGRVITGRVAELRPLGEFATWRAARAVGDHDLNSFLVRVDSLNAEEELEPGMTVWLDVPASSPVR